VVINPPDVKGTKLDIGYAHTSARIQPFLLFLFDRQGGHQSLGAWNRWAAGIISTIGLIAVNMVPAELLGSAGFSYDGGEGRARLFFVISLMLTFGGLTSAIVWHEYRLCVRGCALGWLLLSPSKTAPFRFNWCGL
jgi:hypothetical protein